MLSLLGAGYVIFHLGTAPLALADGGPSCTNRTLKGTYVFTQDGMENRLITAGSPVDHRPFGYAGLETYDGHGNFTGVNTLATARTGTSQPTVRVTEFLEYSGTYTVNPDCTVLWSSTDADGFTSNYHLFLSPDGERFTFISVSATVTDGTTEETVQEVVGVGVAYRSARR
jgi:hypothetical protein